MNADAWKLSLKMLLAVLLLFVLTIATPQTFLTDDISFALFIGGIAAIAIYMRLQAKRFSCPTCGKTIFLKWGISSFFPTSKCSNCGHRFADRMDALRFAAEAHLLAQARHDRWFTGDFAYLAEAEDVWLTLEGSSQWLGYRWLMDSSGGGRSSKVAVQAFGVRGRWWSQRHGFALFAALERLSGSEWKRHAFGDGARTVGEMLDHALLERD